MYHRHAFLTLLDLTRAAVTFLRVVGERCGLLLFHTPALQLLVDAWSSWNYPPAAASNVF